MRLLLLLFKMKEKVDIYIIKLKFYNKKIIKFEVNFYIGSFNKL